MFHIEIETDNAAFADHARTVRAALIVVGVCWLVALMGWIRQ